ncbi:MAG TPA: hypothetical protein PLF75_05720 [Bacteroidales bacterium]|nr:hypothetical protein [Bacteroidales bacterium]
MGINLLPPSDKMPAYYIDTVEVTLTPYTSTFYYANLNNPFVGISSTPMIQPPGGNAGFSTRLRFIFFSTRLYITIPILLIRLIILSD